MSDQIRGFTPINQPHSTRSSRNPPVVGPPSVMDILVPNNSTELRTMINQLKALPLEEPYDQIRVMNLILSVADRAVSYAWDFMNYVETDKASKEQIRAFQSTADKLTTAKQTILSRWEGMPKGSFSRCPLVG